MLVNEKRQFQQSIAAISKHNRQQLSDQIELLVILYADLVSI